MRSRLPRSPCSWIERIDHMRTHMRAWPAKAPAPQSSAGGKTPEKSAGMPTQQAWRPAPHLVILFLVGAMLLHGHTGIREIRVEPGTFVLSGPGATQTLVVTAID